jgi:hypothetical protein
MALTGSRTETLRRTVFALLVIATFGAFFVTQRLKHSPTLIESGKAGTYITGAKHHQSVGVSFRIKRSDEVTVTVVGPTGDDVATIASDAKMTAYKHRRFTWYGYTSAGSPAPNGVYTIRVRLRDQARSVQLTRPTGEVVMIRIERDPSVRTERDPSVHRR